jgi:NADPH2:quinone reductase
MSADSSRLSGREVRSKLTDQGEIELSLQAVDVVAPRPGEILVRVEAVPVNPTDLSLLMGPATPSQAILSGEGVERTVRLPLPPAALAELEKRKELSICPGLEGAGVVVAAGKASEALVGTTVAMFGGGMYATYRVAKAADCLVFQKGMPPAKCAAAFVNPLTALCMIDTLRCGGHTAMVHTAAASNLGQMLVRLCREDGIPLISIVRSDEQVGILRNVGARYVLNSQSQDFMSELTSMIRETGATVAFDAIRGGMLAFNIIRAMENVYAPAGYQMYGSNVMKQIYAYGMLNPEPIQIARGIGMAWSVSGWLMMNHLAKLDAATIEAMKARVVRQIDTVFASHFTGEVPLHALLDVGALEAMARRSTGQKYLVNPAL